MFPPLCYVNFNQLPAVLITNQKGLGAGIKSVGCVYLCPSSSFHKQNVRAQLQPVVVQRGAEGAISRPSAQALSHSSETWDVCVSL